MAELEAKVEQLQTESIYLKKTINELQTYQSIQQPSLALPQRAINSIDQDMAMPKIIRDMYQFWGITRRYFDEQARDFIKLLESASESDTFGYN